MILNLVFSKLKSKHNGKGRRLRSFAEDCARVLLSSAERYARVLTLPEDYSTLLVTAEDCA